MSIINIYPNDPGHAGDTPGMLRIETNDTIDTVITTGYINHAVESGLLSINETDMVLVSTSSVAGKPANQVGWFQPVLANNVWSLDTINSPGTVITPTIDHHIAVYTDTNGTLSEDAATAINGGNIQAGLSGTAGFLASFPGTAAKGSLEFKAVANTGNTVTTISNAAMGQASVVSIPDPGTATASFALVPAALINGNIPEASGTAGLLTDSGVSIASVSGAITQLGQLQQISVTLTPAQVIAAYATPEVLIPAVAGSVAIVHSANVYTASTGHTPFATGAGPIIQYGTTVHGAGTIATGTGLVTGDIEAAASQVRTIGPAASAAYTGNTNMAVTFSCSTAYTGGTGTNITFTLVYELITASV